MNNKEIIKYFYEVVVSENLLDELPQYISKDCVQRVGENEIFIGIDGMRQHLVAVKKTYPDYTMDIIRQFEDGETIISEFIMRGTHKGEFIGITPTNKVLEMTGVDIDKVVNGKIVEHGGAVNTFDAFGENGLIKPV
ncbi:MAG: ester cyclase [Clostridiaceae bacterium]|uniref:Ester cyclase n=1 Tax=Clostridium porci TaxID=2605778 RepID=A0A7X2TB76_9CLOT|nr:MULTISPECIES: ester cyclase [Clostridium]MCI6139029.1 ester cyclase [Clostridium sp.]MDY3231247.1 ester cyclase [Clostridiaceae bacterium]MSS35512.1 ester cyclase [Clostridium porci]